MPKIERNVPSPKSRASARTASASATTGNASLVKAPKIEKGIPIPSTMRALLSPWKFEDMKVGDSFLEECPKEDRPRILNNLSTAARNWKERTKNTKWKFVCRQVDDDELGRGVRVWRVA